MIEGTRPFNRSELAVCARCKRGVAHDNNITFYEVTLTQCVLDLDSIRQQHGLEIMFGKAAAVAAALSPTTNVAFRMPSERRLICIECAAVPTPLLALTEDDPE